MTKISLALSSLLLAGILSSSVTSFVIGGRARTGLNRLNNAALNPKSLSLYASGAPNASSSSQIQPPQSSPVLCELQTFLKLCELVATGGDAKFAIQGGKCELNGQVETRRAKKLFEGDMVSFGGLTLDVVNEVSKRSYVYKVKVKKSKPVAMVDADGNLEFGGRYRSDEWRTERKQKKAERKSRNSESK